MKLAQRCEACGLTLADNDTGDGPAVLMIFVLGFTVVPLVMWFGLALNPPLWAFVLIAVVAVLGTALILLPPAKALFVAQNYRHNPWD